MNAAVYGISGDNPFAQEAWAQKEKITVPLLSDYEHKVAKEYGVMYDSFLPQMNLGMSGVPKRSAFIVDKNGVIQYAESNDDARAVAEFRKDQSEAGGAEMMNGAFVILSGVERSRRIPRRYLKVTARRFLDSART